MNRTIALAYGITGLAVAGALVAIIGTTTGLLGPDATPGAPGPAVAASSVVPPSAPAPAGAPVALAPPAAALQAGVEVVYVDAPASVARRDHDGDDEAREHADRHGERHHGERDHDDD